MLSATACACQLEVEMNVLPLCIVLKVPFGHGFRILSSIHDMHLHPATALPILYLNITH